MTRTDAEVVHAWEERAAILESEAGFRRSEAEDRAAAEFSGREAMVVAIHRQKLAAARDGRQARLF